MKADFILFGVALMATTFLSAQPAPVPPENPFEDALLRAPAERRFILVDFFSYSSSETQVMSFFVRNNSQVKAVLAEKYIVVHAEVEYRRELAARFNVNRTPTLAILAPDGREIDRLEGTFSQVELIKLLREATEGGSSFAQLKSRATTTTLSVEERINLATEYFRRGAHNEAMDHYIQSADACLESKENARYLKSVVPRMAVLANRAPSTGDRARAFRDKLEAKVRAGEETHVALAVELNQRLNERDRNVALFLRTLPFSPVRKQILPNVLSDLVEARQYGAVVLSADLETLVSSFYSLPSTHSASAKTPARASTSALPRPALIDLRAQRLADVVVASTEALLGTGQRRKAERIAGRAMETVTLPALRSRLVEAAARAGGEDGRDFIQWLDREYPAEAPLDAPQLTAVVESK